MSDTFKPGDVVILKSGGPKMTVTQVDKDIYERDMVWCEWFVGAKTETNTFPPEALKFDA